MTDYPDYIGKEAVRRMNEAWTTATGIIPFIWPRDEEIASIVALCQLLTETGFKEPEPRDLVFARRVWAMTALNPQEADSAIAGLYDDRVGMKNFRALLREYAGETA